MQLSLALTPVLPLVAAALLVFVPARRRFLAAGIAIGALFISLVLSFTLFSKLAFSKNPNIIFNFDWLQLGDSTLRLGLLCDPLTAVMLVMVTFVGLLIFIFSAGYMMEDARFVRFFCFLSLFAAAMLGVVVANDLLLLFMSWELVGVASYLLIGFWFFKPEAAAAARKAFITTRIGDVGLFVGMLWLNSAAGTLLFYDGGNGALEAANVSKLAAMTTAIGMPVSVAIGLLIFVGAMSKSGQVPLHVWLPDAMEGPTPVSALIHAATMVAAGVFLMARVHPLLVAGPGTATVFITWIGAITALFGALCAVAQTDIKRILAYSTVSQLGYMMMGLGAAGVAVAMFHLITHAFFKALLFLGAGSVIHGCHGEQDIRQMGGLKEKMPVTFATYGIGMLALAGLFPLAGFWSKDEILHGTFAWPVSKLPFLIGLAGAFLTAFYMTRQMILVFYGKHRGHHEPHESAPPMTWPLMILAGCAVLLGLAWRWFPHFLTGETHAIHWGPFLGLAATSTAIVLAGIWFGKRVYWNADPEKDPLEARLGGYEVLRKKFFFDEIYGATVVPFFGWVGKSLAAVDRMFGAALETVASVGTLGVAWVSRFADEFLVNGGFDRVTRGLRASASAAGKAQTGQIQTYLRVLAVGLTVLVLLFAWGCNAK